MSGHLVGGFFFDSHCRLWICCALCLYVCLLYFCVNCVFYVFLQYFVTVGWVFLPVKTVACITYTVLVETLNCAQSINRKPVCSSLIVERLMVGQEVE